jgi:hypothetical protein
VLRTAATGGAADWDELAVLGSRLADQLACLQEDARDPERSSQERLALVRDRAQRIRGIRKALRAGHVRTI